MEAVVAPGLVTLTAIDSRLLGALLSLFMGHFLMSMRRMGSA